VTITPYLYYEDVEAALAFLAKAFGFAKFGAQMRGPDGRISHAAMKFGPALIMMGRPPAGYRNPRRLGQTTQSLYINVKNVDAHFERAKNAGARVLEAPTDTEYGHRRYGVTDLEGHEWYFAEPLRAESRRPATARSAKRARAVKPGARSPARRGPRKAAKPRRR